MEMGTLGIMALVLGALPLLTLALRGSYQLGRRQRRAEVIVALMDDDAFVRDRGALARVRDQIRERNMRYAKWRRQQADVAQVTDATGTAGAGAGHE